MIDHDETDPHSAAGLAALRAAVAPLSAPRGVEKELLAAFAARHRRRRWYERVAPSQWKLAGVAGGGLAMLLVAFLALRMPLWQHDAGGAAALATFDNGGVFIALDSLERIAQEPSTRVLATDVPRTTLAALGVPVTPENAGDSVRAEMLVSADGAPLALRLSATP